VEINLWKTWRRMVAADGGGGGGGGVIAPKPLIELLKNAKINSS